jgi:hypothetical protein
MTNEFLRGSRPGGYKYSERCLGQGGGGGGDRASKWAGQALAHFSQARGLLCSVLLPESSRVFPLLHVSPCRQFLFELDEAHCLARFDNFLTGSSEFSSSPVWSLGFLESCLLHCLTCTGPQGLVMRCLMNLTRKSCFQH